MAALSSCENAIGYSLIRCSTDIQMRDVGDRMSRNVFFRVVDDRMAKETIVTIDMACIPLRDDISLLIHYDNSYVTCSLCIV